VLTTNDTHVMRAWAETTGAKDRITFLSDGNGEFVRKAGLDYENHARGMGTRSRRFAAIVDDGVVTAISVEDVPGQAVSSSAARILEQL
jgi:peroxiredoxin